MTDVAAPPTGPSKDKGKAVDCPPQPKKPTASNACYNRPPLPPATVTKPKTCSYVGAARIGASAPAPPTQAAAAPPATPSAVRKRSKKSTPKYTRSGPSHHGIVVTFATTIPAANMSLLVTCVNAELLNTCSSLVVDSAHIAFAGWLLTASGIPTKTEDNTVHQVIYSMVKNHTDSRPFVGLPALTSYLMIQGTPYFKDSTGKV
jgi:hypothetical protein